MGWASEAGLRPKADDVYCACAQSCPSPSNSACLGALLSCRVVHSSYYTILCLPRVVHQQPVYFSVVLSTHDPCVWDMSCRCEVRGIVQTAGLLVSVCPRTCCFVSQIVNSRSPRPVCIEELHELCFVSQALSATVTSAEANICKWSLFYHAGAKQFATKR